MEKCSEERPWGKFERFCHNQKVTVKIISVKPNSRLSLQYHNKREEFWRVISGSGQIVLGNKVIDVLEGDEFLIPIKTNHRIIAINHNLKILEISFGNFDEDDIVRLEDDYSRI
ncbi:mannose-6-phosphate isomerase [archaeon]|nr:mannose-6-phosphate isomerase [archaeon]|tara:strand:+ start:731 stop:1072 length:342 start_codon:yes stop_codon:yes gene_type:complete